MGIVVFGRALSIDEQRTIEARLKLYDDIRKQYLVEFFRVIQARLQ